MFRLKRNQQKSVASKLRRVGLNPARLGRILWVLLLLVSLAPAIGVEAAPVSQTASGGNFGSVNVGTTANSVVTFSNTNPNTINITGYSIVPGGSAFSVTGTTCSGGLAPNASCTYNVSFSPTNIANYNATLEVAYGTAARLIYPISLSGQGFTLGTIVGKITLQGKPYPGPNGKVTLDGRQQQYVDAWGNYGYGDIKPGNHTIGVDYDRTLYVTDNGLDTVKVSVSGGAISYVNFNLIPRPVTNTPVTTTPPTTTAPPTATVPPTTTVPSTTESTGAGSNCAPTSPIQGRIDLVVCRAAELPPIASGKGNRYVLTFTLHNGLQNTINVQNTVEIPLANGVSVVSASSDVGSTRTEDNGKRVIWSGYDVPSGRSAVLSLTVEAPPASAGTVGSLLSQDVFAEVIDAVTGSRYEGYAGAISSQTGQSRTQLQPQPAVPGKAPATGSTNSVFPRWWGLLLVGSGTLSLAISGLWSAYILWRKRARR
ncbi:choice-of-anchor D domain-containing protein [Candidatus Chlorohelix sp.]|uniref:choice-of-anchor D domain-containing protein n=1 Tax=Candidatus Chlorohelix sp. TaxID=3139201 RepID=UPI0030656183